MEDSSFSHSNSVPPVSPVVSMENGTPSADGMKYDTLIDSVKNGVEHINIGQSTQTDMSGGGGGLGGHAKANSTGPRRADEFQVDFSDTRNFAAWRWGDIITAATQRLLPADRELMIKYAEWSCLQEEIQSKLIDPTSTTVMKRLMTKINPLPRSLSSLAMKFANMVTPFEVNFDSLWGILYLNLKYSYGSLERLTRTCEWLFQVRRVVELFNRCLDTCEGVNETRFAVVDFLDPIVTLAVDSIMFLHETLTDEADAKVWPEFNENIATQISLLDSTVRHLNDITNYSKVNQDQTVKNMSLKHALIPEAEETAAFPIKRLPFNQNPHFYGRQEELEKITKYLAPKGDQSFRTYTIYGRRGVGKTDIALQFAHTNSVGYDAIFWIQCETSVAIRQSFTNVAIDLNLPRAIRDGRHEENLLAVQQWLKRTSRRWLLIFDNAENDQILQGYWPVGASGAILITSRLYFNFSKDVQRQGDTIKPFNDKQSWELLLEYLGDDWKSQDRKGLIDPSEMAAAKGLLKKLEGLALAIQQAANLITNSKIGGPTMATNFAMFKERMQTLPDRQSGERSSSELALDTLWDMVFSGLSRNARILLGVFSWLSSDVIYAELFLPLDERALDGSLSFCKIASRSRDEEPQSRSSAALAPALIKALDELLDNKLIRWDGRMISIHRVVQEATNYHDQQDLQDTFNSAVSLVYEAFPGKNRQEGSLYDQWSQCSQYIPHGVFLSKKYSEYSRSGTLIGSEKFVKLLSNCAWYLFEIGDFEVCYKILDTAKLACQDKNSLLYADLRNTSGARYYELNKLKDCRRAYEEVYRIRQKNLPHDHNLIGAIMHNIGNLETASGNLQDAMKYLEKAQLIAANSNSNSTLAKIYLGISRIHYLHYQFEPARKWLIQAELLVTRSTGADKGFMDFVHYYYGNLELIQKHYDQARREYEACLKIALSETPIHPIVPAAYYSLACVEFELKHIDTAIAFLEKANTIAELRSPSGDDGVIARILWKKAVVLESYPFGEHMKEAAHLRKRAELARASLLANGEGGYIPFAGEKNWERNEEEDDYDSLVPLYYR